MNVEATVVAPQTVLLTFENQFDLTSSLLRFQEHYEGPYFRGKVFSLAEFKAWYKTATGQKKFTYYTDWNGFNFPSTTLYLFRNQEFNPLSVKEKKVLRLLTAFEEPFYVIAVHKEKFDSVLDHELKHALFYLNKEYRDQVLTIIGNVDCLELGFELMDHGYTQEVIPDEINAYVTGESWIWKSKFPKRAKARLVKLYKEFAPCKP